MKKETYEKAMELQARISHVEKIIAFLNGFDYSLEPPTRPTSYDICIKDRSLELNEGEIVMLRKAFEDEKFRLNQEFVML